MIGATPNLEPEPAEESRQGQSIPVKVIKPEEPIRVTDRRFWVHPEGLEEVSPADYSFKPTYVEELERKLAESQKQLEEVRAAQRAYKAESVAEAQRARERIQNEYNRRLSQAESDIVRRFLDILENFERALAAAKEQPAFESLRDGVQMIHSQFGSTLAELGVTELDVADKPFNPELAEAIGVVEVSREEQDHQVLEVVNKAYALGRILIRPARVKVGRFVAASEVSAMEG